MEAPTARETEVLELICQGCSTKEIAHCLGIAFKTAESHRSHLFEKAGVDNAVCLFRWALEEGYVTVNRNLQPHRNSAQPAVPFNQPSAARRAGARKEKRFR